jgi:predicted transglutaminase-like cysteine proteinase
MRANPMCFSLRFYVCTFANILISWFSETVAGGRAMIDRGRGFRFRIAWCANRATAATKRVFASRTRLITLLVAILLSFAAVARADVAGLFGTREIFSTDRAAFTKWNGVVARSADESCGDLRRGAPCPAQWWENFVAELARLPLRARVSRANAVLNGVRFVSAEANWGSPNHWETPFEFLARGGQCEDYAIAKYMALAASGVPENSMRLVVVRDIYRSLDHAVTVVMVDGEALVLDSQVMTITPAASGGRYVPYYSINSTGWWRDLPATMRRVPVAR